MVDENISIGTKIPCLVNRTIDIGDFSLLHSLTWFTIPVHVDGEYAKKTWFGERSLAGPIIFVLADGLIFRGDGLLNLLDEHGWVIAAYVGIDSVKITTPVLFGDTIRADVEVTDFKTTKNSKRNLMSYTNKTYNQRNQLVVQYTTHILVEKKG